MFSWLLIIILAYLFFSLSSFGDKLILNGPLNPKLYTFYVGFLGGLVVFLIPFITFSLPSNIALVWIILEAIVFILGVYFIFSALEKFEVSKVIPTVGVLQPVLIFILTWIFFGPQIIKGIHFLAFLILLLGGFFISMEKTFKISAEYLKLTILASLMFSLDHIFLKLVFLNQPFLQGLIWTRLFIVLFVLIFLFGKEFRKQIFVKKVVLNKKTAGLFLFTQSAGGIAVFLQSFAISLVPITYLSIVNALKGIQYVFLFLITLFFSFLFPKILKEEISKKIIIQKTIAISFIIFGLVLLIY